MAQGMMIQRSNNSGLGGDAGQVGSVAMQAELAVWGGWGVVGQCPTLCSAEERAVHACGVKG